MSAREHNSLQRQLSRCWGANRRAAAPVLLHLAGLAQCPAACLPPGGDHLRWKVHRLDERVEESGQLSRTASAGGYGGG